MKKKELEDKPLEFLLNVLKPIYPEIELTWSREQVYGLLLKKAPEGDRVNLSAAFMNNSDTARLMQETLKANKQLCSWTLGLTIVTFLMAVATGWMALSTYQMANAPPSQPQIGYTFDVLTGLGRPILLKKPRIRPKEMK